MQLDTLQESMIAAIDKGPDFIPYAAFAGGPATVQRGLSVHANTISHARLVALEETFPRTRTLIGDEAFNRHTRSFIETPRAVDRSLDRIGEHFPRFLSGLEGHKETSVLASFEWAWLEAYHAADAEALDLTYFAGATEETLLSTVVRLHPAARLANRPACPVLADEIPALAQADAILITRPDADVLLTPAEPVIRLHYDMLAAPQPICNLLDLDNEQSSEDGLHGVMKILQAGSLVLGFN